MNTTSSSSSNGENYYEYSTFILGTLFVVSELLPFIKKTKGNSIVHSIICLLRGSSCVAEKIADTLEEAAPDAEDSDTENGRVIL